MAYTVLQNHVPRGQLIFTCSDTLAAGCTVYPQHTASQTDRRTDGRTTDDGMMPIADHTAYSSNTIG